MTALRNPPKPPPPPPPSPRVTWSDGVVDLRDERLFGPGGEAACERFLGRVFRVDGVTSVAIDRGLASAAIRHGPVAGGRAGLLQRLAAALRDDSGEAASSSPTPPVFVRGEANGSSTVYRRGPRRPDAEVLYDRPGRLRLRIDALRRNPALAQRVERLVGSIPGVRRTSAGPHLGRLLIVYDPAALSRARLVDLVGEALHGPDAWARSLPEPAPVKFGVANTTLGIAAVGEFALPALLPVSALLLVATNVPTFRTAWLQVRQRRCGLPVLYTAIVGTTLGTGQFVSSALMTWLFRYWHRRSRNELATGRHRMLDWCVPLPGLVRLRGPKGVEVIVEAEQIRPGDRVIVSAGEAVPGDGRVSRGEAVVDERSLRGLDGATRKRPGDPVFAGSLVLAGELHVLVERAGEQTRAAAIGRALVAATSPAPGASAPTRPAEAFAGKAVGPTLATAGLGLLVGDLTSAGAILRPDYATGPGLGVTLHTLRDVALCARKGVVVRDPSALERLGVVDLVVLDDVAALSRTGLELAGVETRAPESEILREAASAFRHLDDPRAAALREACLGRRVHLLDLEPVDLISGVAVQHRGRIVRVREDRPGRGPDGPLRVEVNGVAVGVLTFRHAPRPEAAGVIRRLRGRGTARFALVSERPAAEAAPLAAALGVNQLRGGLGPEGKAAFLRDCRVRGIKAAFVGDCRRNSQAAAEAHVAVALTGDADPEAGAGPPAFQILGDRLDRLEVLADVARSHADRVRADHALVVAPNVFCVAGAFFFGFTGLTSVVISNLGTYGVYARASGGLRALGASPKSRAKPSGRSPART